MLKINQLCIAVCFLFLACQQTTDKDKPQDTQALPIEADCAYCGMPTADYPKTRALARSQKGEQHFCSPRCLFTTLLENGEILSQVAHIQVVDYYELKAIDGKTAYYVIGSNIMGAMGKDLIPVGSLDAAEELKKDHNGTEVLTISQISFQKIVEAVR